MKKIGSPLDSHTQKWGKELFKCVKCGRKYLHRRNLWRHMKLECGKEPAFQCPYCPKRTKQKVHMKTHIIMRHKNDFPGKQQSVFKC
jgi:DNA-directed RNA polymerase subunit RPC12/RpoP